MDKKINCTIETYENNFMALSCYGEMKIVNSIVESVSFKGMPRPGKDAWVSFYRNKIVGDIITDDNIRIMLSYNGVNNIVSEIKGS